MNALEVKQYLLDNTDKLESLLENIGMCNIKHRHNEIRCARNEDSNPTSIRITLNENLGFIDFARSTKGDIYKLVSEFRSGLSFPVAFQYVCNFLGVNGTLKKVEKPKIFGGFFSEIKKYSEGELSLAKTYPTETLKEYELCPIEMFLNEGISIETQNIFQVRYDWNSKRIALPEFNFEGELIGVTGRWNGENYDELMIPKYYPIIEFPKSQSLYGYHINYYNLIENNIWLFESQKSVLKLHSKGIYNCLAIGGKFISPIQIKYIQSLNPKSVIIAFDEGVKEEEFIKECLKLKSKSSFLQYKVGYLYDKDHEYLKESSKDAPADLALNKFREMAKKLVRWIY